MTNHINVKTVLQNMSNQLFDVQEKLTSQEYKDLYDNLGLINKVAPIIDYNEFRRLENELDNYGNDNEVLREQIGELEQELEQEQENVRELEEELEQDEENVRELEEENKLISMYNLKQKLKDAEDRLYSCDHERYFFKQQSQWRERLLEKRARIIYLYKQKYGEENFDENAQLPNVSYNTLSFSYPIITPIPTPKTTPRTTPKTTPRTTPKTKGPKKRTAYNVFFSSKFSQLQEQNPNKSIGEMSKIISKEWVKTEDKMQWEQKAHEYNTQNKN
jgi:TolA-binding protein